jgi:hypothetical protein
MNGFTCIHAVAGLCEVCQVEYELDPLAWIEFGSHEAGIRRYRELLDEIAADAARERRAEAGPYPGEEFPF